MQAEEILAGEERRARIVAGLGSRNIVLVGLMGAGKTSVGRRLALALGLSFVDADVEIEAAANQTIAEIFSAYGEEAFRAGERRVISRLLAEGPKVVATGGGAFMSEETRQRIRGNGISVWLKADVRVLLERVRRKSHRPLLQSDPEGTLRRLQNERGPTYATADLTVNSHEGPFHLTIAELLDRLETYLAQENKA
ncbi:shikimate kinase [Faunimonas pinastri]|uniref:Shikimate kinase n=1 Tax=Faunimonas pinastri TaxID=1855383 RepID=A0A1H9C8M4_9HYPH|nr:shikimate kinase [Faunimonas pinastri]SEP97018.1 shikimate kinase [Faunimonas pinastri]